MNVFLSNIIWHIENILEFSDEEKRKMIRLINDGADNVTVFTEIKEGRYSKTNSRVYVISDGNNFLLSLEYFEETGYVKLLDYLFEVA